MNVSIFPFTERNSFILFEIMMLYLHSCSSMLILKSSWIVGYSYNFLLYNDVQFNEYLDLWLSDSLICVFGSFWTIPSLSADCSTQLLPSFCLTTHPLLFITERYEKYPYSQDESFPLLYILFLLVQPFEHSLLPLFYILLPFSQVCSFYVDIQSCVYFHF